MEYDEKTIVLKQRILSLCQIVRLLYSMTFAASNARRARNTRNLAFYGEARRRVVRRSLQQGMATIVSKI